MKVSSYGNKGKASAQPGMKKLPIESKKTFVPTRSGGSFTKKMHGLKSGAPRTERLQK